MDLAPQPPVGSIPIPVLPQPQDNLMPSDLVPEILSIVNNRRITEHSAMIWNIPANQTVYNVVASFQAACGEVVGVGAMHSMREDPNLQCIRASFATAMQLQIGLSLSGSLWGGSKLLIRKYKGPNHGKTNSNLLLAQHGFNLNGINNLPSNLSNMSLTDIQRFTSEQQLNPLANNGAINAGRGNNKTMAQQIFSQLDMQQLAYLMLVQQHVTQNKQFAEQQLKKGTLEKGGGDDEKEDEESSSDNVSDIDTDELEEELRRHEQGLGTDEMLSKPNKHLNRERGRKRKKSPPDGRRKRRRYRREDDDIDDRERGGRRGRRRGGDNDGRRRRSRSRRRSPSGQESRGHSRRKSRGRDRHRDAHYSRSRSRSRDRRRY